MEMSSPVSEEVKTGVEELIRIINNSFNVQHFIIKLILLYIRKSYFSN